MNLKQTLGIWSFGLTKIPLILFVRPRVIHLDANECRINIPLRRRTQNHLKSMYFGALAIGADLAAGLLAMQLISENQHKISLVFKDMSADFLKRVDGDAIFTCVEGDKIRELVDKVSRTDERHHEKLTILVTSPEKYGDEVLADFKLTLSLKKKQPA